MRHSKRNHGLPLTNTGFKVQDTESAPQRELAGAVTSILTQTLLYCLIFGALTAAHVVCLPLYGKFPKPTHTSSLVRKHRSQPRAMNTVPFCLLSTGSLL